MSPSILINRGHKATVPSIKGSTEETQCLSTQIQGGKKKICEFLERKLTEVDSNPKNQQKYRSYSTPLAYELTHTSREDIDAADLVINAADLDSEIIIQE